MAVAESRPLFIRLTLPEGLEEALEGLAREVLRTQPENIIDFAADYFDLLLKKRDAGQIHYIDKIGLVRIVLKWRMLCNVPQMFRVINITI